MGDIHIVPIGDLREHVADRACWCHPADEIDEPDILIHHSLDGREAFENGTRLPS